MAEPNFTAPPPTECPNDQEPLYPVRMSEGGVFDGLLCVRCGYRFITNDQPDELVTPFQHDLSALLNRHSQEIVSNTPDFILAQFLRQCLDAFNGAVNRRGIWYYGEEGEQVANKGTPLVTREASVTAAPVQPQSRGSE